MNRKKKKNRLTKGYKQIIAENTFTLFNLVNLIIVISLILVGSYRDTLFIIIILINIFIGIFQEIRAKISVDKLSLLSAGKIRKLLHDGTHEDIDPDFLCVGDKIIIKAGDQILVDAKVISGNLALNESLITGESNLIIKSPSDSLKSGSFAVSGKGTAVVTATAEDSFAQKLEKSAKYIKKVDSQIAKAQKRIIKLNSLLLIPVGILVLLNAIDYNFANISAATVSPTCAALIGMIPEGLMLLTTTVLSISVIRLSRSKILVSELFCIESLARVDTLCLDKTGTLTTGEMKVEQIESFSDENPEEIITMIAKASVDENQTITAIREHCEKNSLKKADYNVAEFIPFSSQNKCSGVKLVDGTQYMMGSLNDSFFSTEQKSLCNSLSEKGYRVLSLWKAYKPSKEELPKIKLLAFIVISDVLRSNAAETVSYFKQQNVDLKIISGDSLRTVVSIAKTVGLEGCEKAVDLSGVHEDNLDAGIIKNSVFARATPEHKIKLIKLLKESGKYVAMTGDGVNDVPALKESDCSIAMGKGSGAAREVSNLVLLNNDFSALPKIVKEGRRTINNVERSASLFIIKTLYSMILAIIFIFAQANYPFVPIQMSLISAFTIGIPSFILALEPNFNQIKGNFFQNILRRALPGSLTVVTSITALLILNEILTLPGDLYNSLAVIITALIGVLFVIKISTLPGADNSPALKMIRFTLIVFIIAALSFALLFFGNLLLSVDLAQFNMFTSFNNFILLTGLCGFAFVAFYSFELISDKIFIFFEQRQQRT